MRALGGVIRVCYPKIAGGRSARPHALWPKVVDGRLWSFCGREVTRTTTAADDEPEFTEDLRLACRSCIRLVKKHARR